MSKIKFNKEWFMDNKVAINCKTNKEAMQLFREFIKIDIKWNKNDNKLSIHNTYFDDNKDNICYTVEDNFYNLTYQYKDYFLKENYTIINFSDLEFESDVVKNEPKITKYENEECGYDLPVEVDKSDKNHILRGNVKLNSGDIVYIKEQHNNGCHAGIISGDYIYYNHGAFDSTKHIQDVINEDLLWYIPKKSITEEFAPYISKLLFENELYVELYLIAIKNDKYKKKTVKICEAIFHINANPTMNISDDKSIAIGDIVSPIRGIDSYRYGIVTNTRYEDLTEEEIYTYNKIIKIK